MADSFVTLPNGQKVDTSQVSIGGSAVERQRIAVCDPDDAAARAKVTNAAPAGTEYGFVTRPIPSGTQNVADGGGSLTVDDGAGSLTVDSPQLPGALVSGRFDVNLGAMGANVLGAVKNVQPSVSDYGLVTRPIPSASAAATATWDSTTPLNTAITIDCAGFDCAALQVFSADVFDGGALFEVTADGVNWQPWRAISNVSQAAVTSADFVTPDDLFFIATGAMAKLRIRLFQAISSGSITLHLQAFDAVTPVPSNVVTQPVAAGLNAQVIGLTSHDGIFGSTTKPLGLGGYSHSAADSAPVNKVSAAGDIARLICDRDGALYTRTHPARIWNLNYEGSATQTDLSLKAAPGGTLRFYITDLWCSTGAAVVVTLKEGAGGAIKWRFRPGAADSRSFSPKSPIKFTASAALVLDVSAAVDVSLTVTGFTAE